MLLTTMTHHCDCCDSIWMQSLMLFVWFVRQKALARSQAACIHASDRSHDGMFSQAKSCWGGHCCRSNIRSMQGTLSIQGLFSQAMDWWGAHCSRSNMWSIGHWNGSCREEPGMLPSWGAHQRSMPHHSCGITSVRFRLLAIAMAVRTCCTPQLSCLPQKKG